MPSSPVAVTASLLVVLTSSALSAEQARVEILSATVRDQKIDGATVILQRNGEQSSSVVTDSGGGALLPKTGAIDPATLLIVRHPGYSDLIAKCPCEGMTYALSPVMQKLDGMRIVLNWGAEPRDLDGHLAFPSNHVFFRDQKGNDAYLDVDHIDGFGPETITVSRKHAGERYVYAVQDYTNWFNPSATALSASHAKVFVYVGQTLIKTYYVPTHRNGNVWAVFAVSGEGEIQDIDQVYSASLTQDLSADRIFGAYLGGAGNVQREGLASDPADQRAPPLSDAGTLPPNARALNVQGEAAYRSGDFSVAIRSFRSAIEQYPAYGQAYSNLGLAFQKSGRVAEALWANRKAISLAAGPHAAQTRASTHFNNGRIYEDALQWDDALREFRAAEAEKPNDTYAKAIERMRHAGAN